MLKRLPAAALAVMLLAMGPVAATAQTAQDELVGGLAVGQRIPEAFVLGDQSGAKRDFASLAGKNGLVLLFTRSLDW